MWAGAFTYEEDEAKAYTKPPCPSTDPGCAVTRKASCGANPFCAPGSAPIFNPWYRHLNLQTNSTSYCC